MNGDGDGFLFGNTVGTMLDYTGTPMSTLNGSMECLIFTIAVAHMGV